MNDINEMPPVCAYCPYWEVCKPPYICPDIGDNKPKRTEKRTETHACDLISRKDAIDALVKDCKASDEGMLNMYDIVCDLKDVPSAQPLSSCIHENDTISRKAAIDAVHKNYDVILDFTSDGQTISSSIEDILSELPSAQPENTRKRTETHACDLIDRQPSSSCVRENDTISRRMAIDAIFGRSHEIIKMRIGNLPSAQPERKKGKWIAVTEDGDVYKRICSCCGREAFFQNDDPDELYDGGRYELSDFCPHCGADMRKDEQE